MMPYARLKPGIKGFATGLAMLSAATGLAGCRASDAPQAQVTALSEAPLFDQSIAAIQRGVDARMEAGVPVPVPADAGGGYTHEQHKQNGKTIYEAGMLYETTGDRKYRDFAASILQDYAAMYPGLGPHPARANQVPGRLFWQSLNEAMWMVYAIQGYDAIRGDLDAETRTEIENGVLRPVALFLSEGQPQTFNRVHNHGTWAVAAVGMAGYVLDEPEWVEQALLGLDLSGEAGFLRQLDVLFSPDGYYAEGPYYQRFAMMPFVLFAQAIEKNDPERAILDHRDGILLKAVYATVQQSYGGKFFPINDAIREKGLNTVELKYALAIAYELTGDPTLLDVVTMQSSVVPTPGGRALARDIAAGKAEPFQFKSMLFRDGADGDQGALAVLRSGAERDAAAVVFKPTSQGLGHGHFDRLGFIYYDDGGEVVADYGAARFLNVEPKNGGRYLPENESWAKQSIAHNVLVVDEESQFGGDWRVAQEFAPDVLAFGTANGVQFTAAEIDTAYDGVSLQRLLAMAPRAGGGSYIIDVMRARSGGDHTYDLPVHFKGQLIETGFGLDHATTNLTPFGARNGYQHLWQRAVSDTLDGSQDMSWLIDDQFYTLTFAANAPLTAYLTELGANDPDHNLRREQALVLRAGASDFDIVSVYERHGRYDNDEEVTVFNGTSVADVSQQSIDGVDVYTVHSESGDETILLFAEDTSIDTEHTISLDGMEVSWTGPIHAATRSTE
ncbi:MAG: heparinase II/III family protein [Pseudomonadota bacterium]